MDSNKLNKIDLSKQENLERFYKIFNGYKNRSTRIEFYNKFEGLFNEKLSEKKDFSYDDFKVIIIKTIDGLDTNVRRNISLMLNSFVSRVYDSFNNTFVYTEAQQAKSVRIKKEVSERSKFFLDVTSDASFNSFKNKFYDIINDKRTVHLDFYNDLFSKVSQKREDGKPIFFSVEISSMIRACIKNKPRATEDAIIISMIKTLKNHNLLIPNTSIQR